MTDPIHNRETTLANGDRVPLFEAARCLATLGGYLAVPDTEWDVVFLLREQCLSRDIEPEQLRTLADEKLATPDGEIDPTLRAVVLSAVRGEGRVLHLASPFTDPVDRRIAEFVTARDALEGELAPEAFQQLLAGDGFRDQIRRVLRDVPLPPGIADPTEFARRVWQRKPPSDPSGPAR